MYRGIILKAIKFATGVDDVNLDVPENADFGDYSTNIALRTGIKAEELVAKLEKDPELAKIVDKIEVVHNFINFWLTRSDLVSALENINENYGKSKIFKGQTYLVEHTSPNPNKAMHLGHLRNNVTGMAIANLFEAIGVKVIRDCIDNDRGIAIAKLMWGYRTFADGKSPEDLKMRPDRFVDMLYVKASEKFEANPEVEKEVRQMVVDWEAGDTQTWVLWKKVLGYSYKGQELTLKRLGNHWDKVWHEHEHYQSGKKLVELGLKAGIFKELESGAVVTNLAKYKLPDTIVIKSDGTALYITQDLALTKLKKETFKADKLFWVIGPEQSLAMQQVFAVCEQLGIGKMSDFTHIAYGYMSIKGQGKMSSRSGNVVYIDDLLDLSRGKVKKIMEGGKIAEKDIGNIAEMVGVGAVKYSILKTGRLQDIAFDVNESVSLEGNSGPYLQYTVARTNSVLLKGSDLCQSSDLKKVGPFQINTEELSLLRTFIHFPEIVESAARHYAPNLVCNYLYDLAQKFNNFYNLHRIIGSDNVDFRLKLTSVTGQILKTGLQLLGIATPEKM